MALTNTKVMTCAGFNPLPQPSPYRGEGSTREGSTREGKKHDLSKNKFSKILVWNQYFQYILYMMKVKIWCTSRAHVYLPHILIMGSAFFTCHIWNMREVLVSCREKRKNFIANFHVLGLFMAKKHDLSDKKFSVCHAPLPLPLPLQKFVSTLAQSLWKLESWNFDSRSLLGQLDVPHTQNFEIWNP
jgi:hypothetical protein